MVTNLQDLVLDKRTEHAVIRDASVLSCFLSVALRANSVLNQLSPNKSIGLLAAQVYDLWRASAACHLKARFDLLDCNRLETTASIHGLRKARACW
jgi:hypothetical protein